MPTQSKGAKLVKKRSQARRKAVARKATPAARAKKSKPSKFQKSLSEYRMRFQRVRESIRESRADAAKKKGLTSVLAKEPKAVRNYVRRAMSRGQTVKAAISQGRILYNAGRLKDDGTLKGR